MLRPRPFGSLLMIAMLALSLVSQAETHAHGHCAAASPAPERHGRAPLSHPAADGAPLHQHTAHAATVGSGAEHRAAQAVVLGPGAKQSAAHAATAGLARTSREVAAPMANCDHCTSGGCEMTTGCSTSGAPVSLTSSALHAAAEIAAARPVRGLAIWRSASLDPPTPPPNRLG